MQAVFALVQPNKNGDLLFMEVTEPFPMLTDWYLSDSVP